MFVILVEVDSGYKVEDEKFNGQIDVVNCKSCNFVLQIGFVDGVSGEVIEDVDEQIINDL